MAENGSREATSPAPGSSAPFGPGYRVDIDSSRPFVYAWLARGAVDTGVSYPDSFIKIGRLPTSVELPPGSYTLIVEGDAITRGTTVFRVGEGPHRVRVEAGSGALRELSSWMVALGTAAVLAAGVLYVSGTKDDAEDRKNAIALPLVIGGGVVLAGGVTLMVASGTGFRGGPGATEPRNTAVSCPYFVSLGGRF